MADKRSLLDRSDLYWPAPRLSGQASYGGVLRIVWIVSGCAIVVYLLLAWMLILLMGIFGYDGSTGWVWLSAFFMAFITMFQILKLTNKRRDSIDVLWEAWKIERKEDRA